jgi:acetyl-CoA carboxylase biotin carboxyl carrier protein
MTLDEIRELIKVVTETGVAELEVQRGDDRVRIRRALPPNSQEVVIPAQAIPASASPPPSSFAPAAPASSAPPVDILADPSLVIVKSPIVGTFYEAPSPGAPPFVRVGDTVQPNQVLCIIESMKLMNEIEAEMAGVIVSKLMANAQPVEYGEGLFVIRPV